MNDSAWHHLTISAHHSSLHLQMMNITEGLYRSIDRSTKRMHRLSNGDTLHSEQNRSSAFQGADSTVDNTNPYMYIHSLSLSHLSLPPSLRPSSPSLSLSL